MATTISPKFSINNTKRAIELLNAAAGDSRTRSSDLHEFMGTLVNLDGEQVCSLYDTYMESADIENIMIRAKHGDFKYIFNINMGFGEIVKAVA